MIHAASLQTKAPAASGTATTKTPGLRCFFPARLDLAKSPKGGVRPISGRPAWTNTRGGATASSHSEAERGLSVVAGSQSRASWKLGAPHSGGVQGRLRLDGKPTCPGFRKAVCGQAAPVPESVGSAPEGRRKAGSPCRAGADAHSVMFRTALFQRIPPPANSDYAGAPWKDTGREMCRRLMPVILPPMESAGLPGAGTQRVANPAPGNPNQGGRHGRTGRL